MPKRISLTDIPQIYCERNLTEILPDTLVPFNDDGSGRVATIPVHFTFEEGGKYHVVFDREAYDLVYSAGLEFTTGIANTIDLKYIPSPPEFVVDATNLPTNCDAWGELCTSLEDAYNSGHDIFLDVYGNGGTKLKLTNHSSPYSLFLYPESRDTICAYILEAWYRDGGSLTKYSLTATEVT